MSNLPVIAKNFSGASFISMDTVTTPVLLGGKKNPMQGRIRKHNKGASIQVFQNKNTNAYKNMVERRLVKEGKEPTDFKLSPRRWGTRVANMPIVEHKGADYLEVIFLKAGVSSYTLDGKAIDKADIEGLKVKPVEGKQGGLEDKVTIRTFKAESIERLKIGNMEYTAADIQA